MKKRHLVTGAAGLIGFELTRQLLEGGDRVLVVDRFLKGGDKDLELLRERFPAQLEILSLDLASAKFPAAPAGGFDSIFHLAAIVGVQFVNDHPYETMRVNMSSTINVLDFAIQAGCRALVFASSSENYACGVDRGWTPIPTSEEAVLCIDDIQLPRWSYAASKIAGESAVFAAAPLGKFTPLIARFHNVYGPRMGPTHVIPEFLQRCARKIDPFPVYGYDATRSFLHVEDAGRALRLIAESSPGGIVNIGSPEEVPIGDLVDLVFDLTGFHPKVEKHPAPPGSVKRRVPDIRKLQGLGFRPSIPLRKGIASCLERPTSSTR